MWKIYICDYTEYSRLPCIKLFLSLFSCVQVSGEWLGNCLQPWALAQAAEDNGSGFQPKVRQILLGWSSCYFYCIVIVVLLPAIIWCLDEHLVPKSYLILNLALHSHVKYNLTRLPMSSETHVNSVMAERSKGSVSWSMVMAALSHWKR